jgi:uncharacterized protein
MAPPNQQDQTVPQCQIQVNGSDLPAKASADLIAVTVHDDIEHPSAFSITLNNWDVAKIKMSWSDEDLFKAGKQVEVKMGYLGKVDTLITGEVTGMELAVHAHHGPRVIVRGYDRGHRLARGRHTMSYTHVTDSDIASTIAGNYGLSTEIETTSENYQYLLQHNQTDAEFLRERATRIGYECYVRDKKLFFRARKHGDQPAVTISQDLGLLEFYPRLTTVGQLGKVEVRSWNPAQKEAWIGTAQSGDETSHMGGDALGLASAADAFGDGSMTGATHIAASQADADQKSRGRLKEMALSYISGEGVNTGRTDLRAGIVASVEGMGKRFSGNYYLMTTTHNFTPKLGYRTTFVARRNAS